VAQVGAAVTVRGLSHTYAASRGQAGTAELTVLDALDLDVAAGEHVALTGPSGSGKSTLLAVLGGLERPQRGLVQVGRHDLAGARGTGLAAYRRTTVGFVFQHFGLLDTLTAAENVELACTLAGVRRADRRRRASGLLAEVGLTARARHLPPQLSGGERQRVAIARALANDPELVLADEPTGNLDGDAGARVADLLERLNAERGCTLVVVTHDPAIAGRAPRRLRLAAGRVAAVRESAA